MELKLMDDILSILPSSSITPFMWGWSGCYENNTIYLGVFDKDEYNNHYNHNRNIFYEKCRIFHEKGRDYYNVEEYLEDKIEAIISHETIHYVIEKLQEIDTLDKIKSETTNYSISDNSYLSKNPYIPLLTKIKRKGE